MQRTRTLTIPTAALAVVLLALPSANALAAGARTLKVPHPVGADAIVVEIDHGMNGWGAEYTDGFDVRVYGDGRVVIQPPVSGDRPPPEAEVLRVGERGVQRLLAAARKARLLRHTDFGEAGVTDQGTSTIRVNANDSEREFNVYALLLVYGDRGLPREQRTARERLRDFVHNAADRSFYETGAGGRS